MRISATTLTLWACTLMTIALPQAAVSQDSTVVALIVEFRGTAYLRTSANAHSITLDPRFDVWRPLRAGQQVRSAPGGVLRILGSAGFVEIPGSPSWYTMRPGSARSREIQRLLEEYGRLGGRDRADPSPVFSPSPHSVVMPGHFVIAWNRGPALRTKAMIIQEPGGREVWRQDSVDGTLGFLAPEAGRQALATYRARSGEGPLLLRLIDSDGNETQVSFSLMSEESERSLRQDLSSWDKDTMPVMSHLGRASIFAEAGMFAPAADEYEAALRAAPESRELLIHTILAHRRTGNRDRIEELERRLPPGTTVQ